MHPVPQRGSVTQGAVRDATPLGEEGNPRDRTPRVAALRLPWDTAAHAPRTPTGFRGAGCRPRRNPVGVEEETPATEPRVAALRLPWESRGPWQPVPQRGSVALGCRPLRNPIGVGGTRVIEPRVAAARQPWALITINQVAVNLGVQLWLDWSGGTARQSRWDQLRWTDDGRLGVESWTQDDGQVKSAEHVNKGLDDKILICRSCTSPHG